MDDPFSQLESYMRVQRKQIKRETVNNSKYNKRDKYDGYSRYMELRKKKKNQKEEIKTWKNLLKKSPEKKKKFRITPSPMRKYDNNSKNRIFYNTENDNKINKNLKKPGKGKRIFSRKSMSTRSYDFTGSQDIIKNKKEKIYNRKNNLIQHYKNDSNNWNKETVVIYKDLINNTNHLNLKKKKKNYEDPKLIKMKKEMERKKNMIRNKESNDVLMGGDFDNYQKLKKKKSKRNISPLKYKYDYVGNFNVCGIKKNYRKFSNNIINEKDMDLQKDSSKRSLVMNPKRKSLMEEFHKKKKFLAK